MGRVIAKGYRVSFQGTGNVINLDCGDSCKLCEYTKNDYQIHFKWVNFMICKLYLNDDLKKNPCRDFYSFVLVS